MLFVGAPSTLRERVGQHGLVIHVKCVATALLFKLATKGGNMIQAKLKKDLRLPCHENAGQNGGRNHFQRRRGCIPCKGALMHWLNVSGVAV